MALHSFGRKLDRGGATVRMRSRTDWRKAGIGRLGFVMVLQREWMHLHFFVLSESPAARAQTFASACASICPCNEDADSCSVFGCPNGHVTKEEASTHFLGFDVRRRRDRQSGFQLQVLPHGDKPVLVLFRKIRKSKAGETQMCIHPAHASSRFFASQDEDQLLSLITGRVDLSKAVRKSKLSRPQKRNNKRRFSQRSTPDRSQMVEILCRIARKSRSAH
jgi:hypothetical protein